MNNYLNNCRIILVNTTEPGNIGSAARAMKTMGVTELYLVSQDSNIINEYAIARACGADDILNNIVIVSTLKEAINGCQYLLGTSARSRSLSSPVIDPRKAANIAINDYAVNNSKVGVIFGQERMGLTNEELSICHAQILIPTNKEYSSLNIASAVQLICYELNLAALDCVQESFKLDLNNKLNNKFNNKRDNVVLADAYEMELFYEHLERLMLKTNFLDPKQPKLLMRRLRRLYNRAQPCTQELNIMRGILAACERVCDQKNLNHD